MREVLVIGHRNPDTDAICSAIGYAEFKRRTDMPQAVAARCGDTNDRINFVLQQFGFPAPRFVSNVSPKVRDVMQTHVVSARLDTTISEALWAMDQSNVRVVPVLDEKQVCRGLLSVSKMTRFFYPAANRAFDSRRLQTTIRQLTQTLGGSLLFGMEPSREEELVLMIGAMGLPSFAKRIPAYPPEKLVVVVGDREDIQKLAIEHRVRALVITGGLPVSDPILDLAQKFEVNVILSPHDSATTAMLSRGATSLKNMIHEHFLSFHPDESLQSIQKLAAASQFQAFPVLNTQNQLIGILSKSDFLKKVERQLILVDHNELSQAVQGAQDVEIIEIIDHHRIGSLTTHQPILFRNEPVGSTSTIVAESFFEKNIPLPAPIAGLLLAGLVSDTLNLTSPTTTERDAKVLARLERLSQIDATSFTEKLFSTGSVLTFKPTDQAITTDCKEYTENGKTFSVAQIEEIGFNQFEKKKAEVVQALELYRKQNGYYFSALMITDVVQQTSLLVVAAPVEFTQTIDYPNIEPFLFELKGIVSRKKQLLPYLTDCLESL